ncbi:MAG TPA: adenylyl-sulfate kinase, partial [Gaiellaceae bacterium]|nr:adenylyl-sulfate kinase [Gaiellaceae bacterium]
FVEVFVDVTLEEAVRRDTKGLYEKARRGELQNFTGVNDPYEQPQRPDIRIDSDVESPEASARRIVALLEERSLIPTAVPA